MTDLDAEKYRSFVFPETVFTAVTAYQNQLVSTKLHVYLTIHKYYARDGGRVRLLQCKCGLVWYIDTRRSFYIPRLQYLKSVREMFNETYR